MDTLNGDAGADTIYSASANEAWDALVAQVLADNAGVVYSVETNSFYQHITTNATWTTANTNANAATLTGLTGTVIWPRLHLRLNRIMSGPWEVETIYGAVQQMLRQKGTGSGRVVLSQV